MKLYVVLTLIVGFFILASIAVVLTTDFNNLSDINKIIKDDEIETDGEVA